MSIFLLTCDFFFYCIIFKILVTVARGKGDSDVFTNLHFLVTSVWKC